MVVEEAEDGQEAAPHRPREIEAEQEEERGGGAGCDPDQADVEVGQVLEPLAALHRGQTLAPVHCPASLKKPVIMYSEVYMCTVTWVRRPSESRPLYRAPAASSG